MYFGPAQRPAPTRTPWFAMLNPSNIQGCEAIFKAKLSPHSKERKLTGTD